MTEQELAGRFITEMQSFSRALNQRLERITDSGSPADRATAMRELRGLADALSTLCTSFQIVDCATLGAALTNTFEQMGDTLPSNEILATVAQILDFVELRIQRMTAQQRILPP